VVVDDQHARTGDVARHALVAHIRLMHRQLYGEPEHRATPNLAFDADLAAHQVDEAGADGEPEASAFVATRGRAVDLREFFEHALQLFGRNADAGILDANF